MKKRIIAGVLCAVLLAMTSVTGASALEPNVAVGAKAALVQDLSTGQILYAANEQARMNPVGLSHILVVFTALKNSNHLSSMVKVEKKVLDSVSAQSKTLEAGEQYRLIDLLYLVLLRHDAAASAVVANAVSGSEKAFVSKMNDLAQEIGMTNSVFSNSAGVYGMADENYTCALDLAKLLAAALDDEDMAKLLTAASHQMAAKDKDTFTVNTDCALMQAQGAKRIPGLITAVTATDKKTNNCTVAVAEKNGARLACILLGDRAANNQKNTRALYQWGFGLNCFVCVKKGEEITSLVPDGSYTELHCVADRAVTYLCDSTFDESKLKVEFSIEEETVAPIPAGKRMGIIIVRYDGEQVATMDLIAENDVEVSMGEQIQTPPLALRMVLLTLVILVLAAAFFIGRKKWNRVVK